MSGNVWEWTLDEWHENYEGAPSQAETPWGNVPPCNQVCDSGSSERPIRGGSWINDPSIMKLVHRSINDPDSHYSWIGFRIRRRVP